MSNSVHHIANSKLQVLALLMIFTYSNLVAQEDTKFINLKSIGGFISTGIAMYELEEGVQYQPIIIGGAVHLPFYQTKGIFNIALDLTPQVGFVPYQDGMEYEFGLNFIFAFGFQVGSNSILSINLGSGPHYITAIIDRQASGFIFSDHFNIAYKRKINTWQLGFTVGIRHISNAGFEEPNLGIENIGVRVSLARLFDKKKQ